MAPFSRCVSAFPTVALLFKADADAFNITVTDRLYGLITHQPTRETIPSGHSFLWFFVFNNWRFTMTHQTDHNKQQRVF